jgi:hypothetical protein
MIRILLFLNNSIRKKNCNRAFTRKTNVFFYSTIIANPQRVVRGIRNFPDSPHYQVQRSFVMKTKARFFFVFFLPAAVIWAQTNPVSDFKYDLNAAGDGVVITEYIGTIGSIQNPSVKVVIPGTIEGYPVTEIGKSAFARKMGISYRNVVEESMDTNRLYYGITEVVIPNSVTVIGENAFANGILAKVTLPNKLLTLEEGAFSGCPRLNAINLPNTLTSIEKNAFRGCGLTAVAIPASVTSISGGAFAGCRLLATLSFAAGSKLETIGNEALQVTALSAVTIPASVTGIGEYAFYECSKLKTVTFAQDSLCTVIEKSAFAGCSALSSINLPGALTKLGIEIDEGKESHTGISGYGVFEGCTALAEITIPESVTVIADKAFKGCSSLVKVTMPAHPITYGTNGPLAGNKQTAFEGCPRLTLASRKAITDTGYTGAF